MEQQIFLTNNGGITSTSANYLANMAKEQAKVLEASINHISFLNEALELLDGKRQTFIAEGTSDISFIEETIKRIGELYSFNAYVREAIKYKENLLNKSALSLEEYCQNIPTSPEYPEPLSENDVLYSKDNNYIQNYLYIESMAASLGKYIHPEGKISLARNEYLYRINMPKEVSGSGRETIIHSYSPSIEEEVLSNSFNELQNTYREYERKLNALKFQLKEEAENINKENIRIYEDALRTYNSSMKLLNTELQKRNIEERQRIASLKIEIPTKLKSIYTYLNTLGGKE